MIKSIVVLKKYPNHSRAVNLSVTDLSNPESGSLSELDLDSVKEIIKELTSLIDSKDPGDYYEWGVDFFSVVSSPGTSLCYNEIEELELPDVATSFLLALMIEIQHFKEQYQEITDLRNIVEQAFTQIKANPSGFRKWPDAPYYETSAGGIIVSLNLCDDDFKLATADFLDQLDGN